MYLRDIPYEGFVARLHDLVKENPIRFAILLYKLASVSIKYRDPQNLTHKHERTGMSI